MGFFLAGIGVGFVAGVFVVSISAASAKADMEMNMIFERHKQKK